MVTWPAALPQVAPIAGYQETLPDTSLRTQMDAGPARMRRRFTAAVRPITINFILSDEQLETFHDFYVTTLAGGSLPFDWVHPRHAADLPQAFFQFRIVRPPTYSAIDRDIWQVPIEFEILPGGVDEAALQVAAHAGSYSISGGTAEFHRLIMNIAAAAGSYTITGISADLMHAAAWILASGDWDDDGVWQDSNVWIDGPGPPDVITSISDGDAGVSIRNLLNVTIGLLS